MTIFEATRIEHSEVPLGFTHIGVLRADRRLSDLTTRDSAATGGALSVSVHAFIFERVEGFESAPPFARFPQRPPAHANQRQRRNGNEG